MNEWISKNPSPWRRYGVAILAFAAALSLDEAMVLSGGRRIFVTFYPFLVIATLYGGLGPGMMALALSCLAATLLWIEPVGKLTIASPGDTISLGLFVLGNFIILCICERFRRAACKINLQAKVLQESECRLALAQQAGKIGVFDWNLLTGKVIWTPEQERLFGLPEGDGRNLMRDLRERYGMSGIAISGYGMEEDMEKSRAAGFMEHLTKPIRFEELKAAI